MSKDNWKATACHVDEKGNVQDSLEFTFTQRHFLKRDGKKPYDLARRLYTLRQNTDGFVVNIKSVGVMELEPV